MLIILGYFISKTVVITGAGGSIGSEISRMLLRFNPRHIVFIGRGENSIYTLKLGTSSFNTDTKISYIIADVKDKNIFDYHFKNVCPDIVFHAAAHKHVPLMEQNPHEAFYNNVIGTRNCLEISYKHNVASFVLISYDKAVDPSSIMGATKRLCEVVTRSLGNSNFKTTSVRFGNVIGSRGSVIPLFKKQILSGGPVTVTHPDMECYFMTIPE